MRRSFDRLPRLGRSPVEMGLLPVLAAIFAFNLGSAAWSAVVAGRLTQDGAGTALLGALYAICEISRLPAALLLPAVTLHYGARRVTQGGLLILLALPLIALSGLGNGQVMLIFILSALPAMAVYVGMPALVLGASKEGRDGWSLAWLGLAGGAGGALGPWTGGLLADSFGLLPVLLLFAAGSAVMLPIATLGPLPPRTAWAGWSALVRWLGRDSTAVDAALGETTVLGGRALGAPAAGSFGDAYGGAYAFGAIGSVALMASALVMALAAIKLRRAALITEPVPLRLS